jgi:P-type Ca2+ transporter type 2C
MSVDRNWHSLGPGEVIESLSSSLDGLTRAEVERRLGQFGPNELVEKEKTRPWVLFLEQFKDFLIIILLAAAAISGVLALTGQGDIWDPILIVIIVLFAAGLGFAQEYRSGRAMEALKQMTAPTATVMRDGQEYEVAAADLVPGDIILLQTGDRIPADARLIEAVNLRTDEAPLTGESTSVEKMTGAIAGEVPVADRRNMTYTGTSVVYGRGRAVVTSTGMATEFGKIAGMLQEVKPPPTPLQVSLNRIGRVLGIACLVICAAVAGVGMAVGVFDHILDAFIWGVSLAVAAVPEALPAVTTICLALGVQRMVKRHALLRRLPAVETLGCTNFICSDKTGTLTQNEMTVRRINVNGRTIEVSGVGYEPEGGFHMDGASVNPQDDSHLLRLLTAAVLCNDSRLTNVDGVWQIKGDPTEAALLVVAAKAGIRPGESTAPRVAEVPFSSERKRMTTIHDTPQGVVAYSKGAPEVVLDSCTRVYSEGTERELREQDRETILQANQEMAAGALRVLGLAYKSLPGGEPGGEAPEDAEQDMVWLGLLGMIDPPREEVKQAVALCREAGITSVMITGDHKLTAEAIARELDILGEGGIALSGSELDKLKAEELDGLVEEIKVYARVSPAHKMRIVEALQNRGHVVAMTGDGANDAPALKKADIGVAMGITGTDVTKEAGAMILTDDNFASIVAAVEEGRTIFANIRKYLLYLLSCNIGEVLLMLAAFVIGVATGWYRVVPLVALQILVVNLVTDGLPALALALEPGEPGIMQRPPRDARRSILDRLMVSYVLGAGLWIMAASLGVFLWAITSGRSPLEAQCLCFVTIVSLELFRCFSCRSETVPLFRMNPLGNRWLLLAVGSSWAITVAIVYAPFLQGPFHTYPMSLSDWGVTILAGMSILIPVEVAKLVRARRTRTA